ncbi:hypothetical protein H4R34_002192 [Dimargaris verticillata]|uniref:Mediator of RNA polymerase II transcription subunit 11 n=1 Tax=Dimargaris verticillata TaxID=2761393 RepID=A0A9W8E9I7_9FUNG|nr:hypothetical protein H4R34_002192 [Dimargaris verticillata]
MVAPVYNDMTRQILAEVDSRVNAALDAVPTALDLGKLATEATQEPPQPIPNDLSHSQSAAKIVELNRVEQKIVQLLTIASETLAALASEDHESLLNENSTEYFSTRSTFQKFETNVKQYMQMLDSIQLAMRTQYHHLAQAGTAECNLPLQTTVYDADKVLDTLTRAVGLIQANLEHIGQTLGTGARNPDLV